MSKDSLSFCEGLFLSPNSLHELYLLLVYHVYEQRLAPMLSPLSHYAEHDYQRVAGWTSLMRHRRSAKAGHVACTVDQESCQVRLQGRIRPGLGNNLSSVCNPSSLLRNENIPNVCRQNVRVPRDSFLPGRGIKHRQAKHEQHWTKP